ncbi:hypothetical protein CTEN210_12773 [Chaetoceros tenuissimus]|uniref:Uncharacterized protein n=1 Tax=Chaetoceros tenuissimus TaxID=426638 RepID=A0AAD3HA69_9STRA|nr:hypothetical protein CTEN210_12773 [Chaetoceros tenuissimus]
MIEKYVETETTSVKENWNSKNKGWKRSYYDKWKKENGSFWKVCRKAILIKMHYTLDKVETLDYLSSNYNENENAYEKDKVRHCRCYYPKLCYKQTSPKRYNSINEVQHQTPFVTRNTWSLEEMFCRDRNKRHVAVIKGDATDYALTPNQIKSSLACYILGVVFAILLCTGFMVWFGLFDALSSSKTMTKNKIVAGIVAAFLIMVILYCVFLVIKDPVRKYRYLKKQEEEDSEILYEVVDHYKTAEASDLFCWFCFFLQILLFFVLPVGAIFHN